MNDLRPPRLAQILLRLGLAGGIVREAVLGDFYEEYRHRHQAQSAARARLWYWREAFAVAGRSLARRSGVGGGPQLPGGRATGPLAGLGRMITRDLPYAVRNLARTPGFTAIVLLSLALGIAPLAAIGGFLNALFFRPLAHVQEPDRLVAIFRGTSGPASWPDLADVAEQVDAFEGVAGFSVFAQFNLTEGEATHLLTGSAVSPSYFDVLRVPISRGRGFRPDDMGPAAEPVAVISQSLWQRRLTGDTDVLGTQIRLNGRDHTIIGIAPEGLLSPEQPVEPAVYVPLGEEWYTNRGHLGLYGIGRLREDASREEALGQLEVLQERLRAAYPRYWSDEPGALGSFAVYSIGALRVRPGQRAEIAVGVALTLILGLLVLSTACANLGNLLLARGTSRGGEIAVRMALGASRRALITMLLVESVLLGCAGGTLGLLGAHWLTQALAAGRVGPDSGLDITIDLRVFGFTAFVSVATGILFGLIPALRSSRPDLASVLTGARTVVGGARLWSFRNVLVIGQIAASLALLVSASVVVRSLQDGQNTDPGFEPDRLVTASIDVGQRSYSAPEAEQFFGELIARLRARQDVEAAALAVDLPLDGSRWLAAVLPEGVEIDPEADEILVGENRVSASYFATMQMPILAGRPFDVTDVDGSAPVVIVNEALADTYWPQGALGKRLRVGESTWAEIAGVVGNAKYGQLSEAPTPHLWVPAAQSFSSRMHVVVRARSDARAVIPAIREAVREMEPQLPMLEPRLMTDVVSESAGDQRVVSILLLIVGAVSLLLAVIGIYGVVSFVVQQRTHEVGVRVALGAERKDVLRLVLMQGVRLLAVGVVIGLVGAFGIAQLLRATLPGIDVLDPLAPSIGTAILALATLAATLVPALRASRVDPMEALRCD